MKTAIYCRPTAKGVHSFYLIIGDDEFFLFSQSYRRGVEDYYGRGVRIDEAINYSRAHRDSAITRTMDKIPMYVKYIEREYDVEVLKRTKKRYELADQISEDYFEPGMMEYLDQSDGYFDATKGSFMVRFESKGTRYEGRTEQIEKVSLGDEVSLVRDHTNKYNHNNFLILTKRILNTLP